MIYLNATYSHVLKYFTLIISLFILNLNQAIAQEDTFVAYKDFLKIRYIELPNKTKLLVHQITYVDVNIKGAEYINNQILFWDYLLTNYTDQIKYTPLEKVKDTIALQDTYVSYISKDEILTPIVSDYISKAFSKTKSKDQVSIDELLNIAVKFFSIDKVTQEGMYSVKVCVGSNDLKSTEANRKPFLEAFAFNTLMKNLKNKKYDVYPYFINAVKEIYKLNLGIDKKEMLLRAQGALFIQMLQSEDLTKLLKEEYLKNKEVLPFVLLL
ncbi:hypothetical protein NWE55_02230 [Myroides albus]|uniref:hypothetical protein n=1 Tax=Myroides albus TaxID=2562892 RepID=UPI00215996E3|nr:hypothetical protein [Myroides albus]UVD80131.1 hypothetical protein NWE55_02230 [Myroides albus]